jgi:hypothetical protein
MGIWAYDTSHTHTLIGVVEGPRDEAHFTIIDIIILYIHTNDAYIYLIRTPHTLIWA